MRAAADDPLRVVLAWHEAVNGGGAGAAGALVADDVEIAGPRGAAFGRDALRHWIGRAGVPMVPRRAFARGPEVVVAAAARWPLAEAPSSSGGDPGQHAEVATAFLVVGGAIARIARHADVPAALADAGLSTDDAVELPS